MRMFVLVVLEVEPSVWRFSVWRSRCYCFPGNSLALHRRHSTRLSTSIFTSTVADSLCEAAFERLENVEDVACETAAIANGEGRSRGKEGTVEATPPWAVLWEAHQPPHSVSFMAVILLMLLFGVESKSKDEGAVLLSPRQGEHIFKGHAFSRGCTWEPVCALSRREK